MGPCSGEENVWTWWLVMTLHHLSKLLHHEFSGLDQAGFRPGFVPYWPCDSG